MTSILLQTQGRCACRAFRSACSPPVRISAGMARHQRREVRVNFFKFGSNGMKADEAGIYGSQKRDDFILDDVEHYFNYMGMLAVDGSYDRMRQYTDTGMHPVDILLLWASQENDTPKVQELLAAGADASVKDPFGKTPAQLATKPEVLALLSKYAAKKA